MRCVKGLMFVALAVLVCAAGGSGRANRAGGRLLSNRQMVAIFGDAGANDQCYTKANCACTRLGSNCIKCDNNMNGGNGVVWWPCCASKGDLCWEDGNPACADLNIYLPATGWTPQVNCCTPCVAVKWGPGGASCKGLRKDAGDYDPCD